MFENIDEIICLGQGGSNSEIALDKFYEHYRVSAYKRSFPTITECIQYVDRNPNSIGDLACSRSMCRDDAVRIDSGNARI